MAEMISSTNGHKKARGARRSKKLSTRVDLTPMVDLGFLLITFFIFTTSLSRPTSLAMKLPKDVPDNIRQKQPVSGVLTIMLAGHEKVFYYERDDFRTMQASTFAGIRSVILAKKKMTKPSDFMVIIKPTREASYKNTIQIFDEMNINAVKRYALVDVDPGEFSWIQNLQ